MGGSQVDHALKVEQRRIRCLVGCWNVEPWDRQVLLLTLETQSRTRHAATDGQHGTDDRPDMEVAQIQSLSQGGDQDLEPGWWRDASEKAGPGLPNCSCMGTGPREDAELLIGVETRKLRRRARYIGRDKVREPQSRVSEVHRRAHDQHRKGRWDSRAGCLLRRTHTAREQNLDCRPTDQALGPSSGAPPPPSQDGQ